MKEIELRSEPATPDVARKNLARLEQEAVQFADASMSANTRRAYASDLREFVRWCAEHGLVATPAVAATVALYITSLAGEQSRKAATIQRKLAAIAKWHELHGHADPTDSEHVRTVWKGIRRTIGIAPTQKRALVRDDLLDVVKRLPVDLRGLRDRAILLFGFESAMRRSELAAMQVSWLEFGTEGVLITVPFSKTNQLGETEQLVVMRNHIACPVEAVETWLASAMITDGAVFRQFTNRRKLLTEPMSGDGIARMIKHDVGLVGYDEELYAGHSLRRGFVTTSHREGKSAETIMETTRHNVASTVRRYIEQDELRRKIGRPLDNR